MSKYLQKQLPIKFNLYAFFLNNAEYSKKHKLKKWKSCKLKLQLYEAWIFHYNRLKL